MSQDIKKQLFGYIAREVSSIIEEAQDKWKINDWEKPVEITDEVKKNAKSILDDLKKKGYTEGKFFDNVITLDDTLKGLEIILAKNKIKADTLDAFVDAVKSIRANNIKHQAASSMVLQTLLAYKAELDAAQAKERMDNPSDEDIKIRKRNKEMRAKRNAQYKKDIEGTDGMERGMRSSHYNKSGRGRSPFA